MHSNKCPPLRANSGVFWQSGQKGALLKYADATTPKETTPLKLTTKVQILTDKNDNSKSSKKENYCSECGKKCHTLTRTKSGMPVCKECYSKLTKIKAKQSKLRGDKLEGELTPAKPNSQAIGTNGSSLLEGTYDEEANAAAFAEALAEWRNGNGHSKADEGTLNGSLGNSASCQTVASSQQRTNAIPEFHNSSSVTYLERLMIRRNRYDPKFLKNTVATKPISSTTGPTTTSSTPLGEEDSINVTIPSPYNVFYEAPPEQWNIPNSQEVDSKISTCINNTLQLKSNTNLNDSHTSSSTVKPVAMQAAIREAWANKEDTGNLSQFFLSGVNEDKTMTHINECQDEQVVHNVMVRCTTGTWKPEQSVVGTHRSLKPQDEDNNGDSDDSDDALDLAECESDKEEWEMDDKITLECLERELQASQLGNNLEQEHQEIINYNSDFEETKQDIQKNEQ